MTNQIHASFREIQKLASLSVFADAKGIAPWMAGVTVALETDTISGIATDRYVIGNYEIGVAGLDLGADSYCLSFSASTCKAISAVKLAKRDIDVCLITYGDGVFSVEYQGIVYRAEVVTDLDKRYEQMNAYLVHNLADSFSGFTMNPSHLVKLSKISKDNWRFDRVATEGSKPAPVVASCDGFTVVIQPVLERK